LAWVVHPANHGKKARTSRGTSALKLGAWNAIRHE